MGTVADKNAVIYRFFHEYPEPAPAIVALTLYMIAGIAILVVTVRARSWFMLTVTVTALLESAGYATRVYMLSSPGLSPYVTSQGLLIISPVLLSIVNYIAAGRILRCVDTSKGWLKPTWVGWLFTASDVLCLILQGSGGGMSASIDESSRNLGRSLLLVGLAIQMFFFTMFLFLTIYIHRCKAYGLRGNEVFRPVFIGLYTTIGLMYVRNVFRFIEFTQGYVGYLATHEVYFYIFDFALIFGCFLLYFWYHMGYYLSLAKLSRPDGGFGGEAELAQTDLPSIGHNNKSRTSVTASSSTEELIRPHLGHAAQVQQKGVSASHNWV